jgi:hypothetical protein
MCPTTRDTCRSSMPAMAFQPICFAIIASIGLLMIDQ